MRGGLFRPNALAENFVKLAALVTAVEAQMEPPLGDDSLSSSEEAQLGKYDGYALAGALGVLAVAFGGLKLISMLQNRCRNSGYDEESALNHHPTPRYS